MESITNRKQINHLLSTLRDGLAHSRPQFLKDLQQEVLNKKVPFPLLEYFTTELLNTADPTQHILLAVDIMKLNGMGKYVVCGQLLRQRLSQDFMGTITTALGFIRQGDEWRACDLIAERVLGNSILNNPAETLSFFESTVHSPTKWDKRAIGVAIHYAVKKNLPLYYVEQSFRLLLSLSQEKEVHTKTGIGWAAKTVTKFHPGLAEKYKEQINGSARWFKSKVQVGKSRAVFNALTQPLTPASPA